MLLHDVQQWFSIECARNRFNVELIQHSGFYVNYIVPSLTSRYRESLEEFSGIREYDTEPVDGEEIFLIRDVKPEDIYLEVAYVRNTGFAVDDREIDEQTVRLNMISTSKMNMNVTRGVKFEVDEILIWDTGASEHLFQYLPHDARDLREKKFNVLLGGSSNHKVRTSYTFSIGFLNDVLLLPTNLNIGYNIVSAGKLDSLRTCQYDKDKFYVVDEGGSIVSKGHIREDKIFYLDDHNLLCTPGLVKPYGKLSYSVIPSGKVNHSVMDMDDYLEGVRSHHCTSNKDNISTATMNVNNKNNEDDEGKQQNRGYTSQPQRFRDETNLMNVLHLRFGHASDRTIKAMFKHGMVKYFPDITYDKIKHLSSTPCKFCALGTLTRRPSKSFGDIGDLRPMQIVCSDIVGKISSKNKKFEFYFSLFVDKATNYRAVYIMNTKDQIFDMIKRFLWNM
jgi:hypothetical protein